MDRRRLGWAIRSVRQRKHWRQSDLAAAAGVSRAAVSRAESGRVTDITLDAVERIARALDISVDLTVRWHGGDLDRLLNARHSELAESVARLFAAMPDWVLVPEVSFSIYGERGVIDFVAWHAETRTLLLIELKSQIVDAQEMLGTFDRKRRLARRIAGNRGWNPVAVGAWIIVSRSKTNERHVERLSALLRSGYPSDGREMIAWLRRPVGSIAGFSLWSNVRQASVRGTVVPIRRVRRSGLGDG